MIFLERNFHNDIRKNLDYEYYVGMHDLVYTEIPKKLVDIIAKNRNENTDFKLAISDKKRNNTKLSSKFLIEFNKDKPEDMTISNPDIAMKLHETISKRLIKNKKFIKYIKLNNSKDDGVKKCFVWISFYHHRFKRSTSHVW